MPNDDWARFRRDLFHAALERSGDERVAFLDEACGGEPDLRKQVEAMVEAHEQTASLEEPVVARSGDGDPAKGLRVGRYEVRRTIASGGMGTVYEATQDQPHRLVALKVLRRGAASRQALKRFRYESEILGRLRHPNIAQVYDAGTYDEGEGGQPYFAMELVKGRRLLQCCAAQDLNTRRRLEIFAKVCDAVQFAHHKGVIHRDLKPDNILVDDFGEPKILDFGVARATDSDIQATTLQTDIGQLIGTVPYMSPEQVAGDPSELDTRSDVYSLGVVLYELLADRLPHDLRDKSIPEAVRIIGEQDPTPLSSISRVYRGDLDTITAKALTKEKDRRYQSAAELAADVRHYLGDEPIVARPASTFYHLGKFARRNKTLVGGVGAVFVVLVGGVVGVSHALANSRREADRAEMINVFLEEILASPDPWKGERELTVALLLDKSAPTIESRFASHPVVAAEMHLTIGRSYDRLGQLKKARKQYRLAAEAFERELGPEHPYTLDALYWRSVMFSELRQHAKAVPIARRAEAGYRRIYGPYHEQTIAAMGRLGEALSWSRDKQSVTEAETILSEAVEYATRTFGPAAETTVGLKWSLSNTYIRHYKFREALPLMRSLLKYTVDKGMEADSSGPRTVLAIILGVTGEPEKATLLAEEAHETRVRLFGREHPITVGTLQTIGLSLQWAGKQQKAREVFEEFLSIQQGVLERENPEGSAFLVARVRLLQGDITAEEALPAIERMVKVNTDPMAPFHGEVGLTAQILCLARLGRFDEARQVLARHPQELMEALPADHFERRLHFQALEEMYKGLGEPEKAAQYRALRVNHGG
jgi:tetratricopeptide (TPR) repeat protein